MEFWWFLHKRILWLRTNADILMKWIYSYLFAIEGKLSLAFDQIFYLILTFCLYFILFLFWSNKLKLIYKNRLPTTTNDNQITLYFSSFYHITHSFVISYFIYTILIWVFVCFSNLDSYFRLNSHSADWFYLLIILNFVLLIWKFVRHSRYDKNINT